MPSTHRFLMSMAPLKAFLGMDWMKFSLKSLKKKKDNRKQRPHISIKKKKKHILTVSHKKKKRLYHCAFAFQPVDVTLHLHPLPPFTTIDGAELKAEGKYFPPPLRLPEARGALLARRDLQMASEWLLNSGCIFTGAIICPLRFIRSDGRNLHRVGKEHKQCCSLTDNGENISF